MEHRQKKNTTTVDAMKISSMNFDDKIGDRNGTHHIITNKE